MDVGEKLFKLLAKVYNKKNKPSEEAIFFDDIQLTLSVLANGIAPHHVELKKADESQSHHLDTIFLPTSIDLFKSKELNFQAFIYRSLFAAQVIKDQIFYTKIRETERHQELLMAVEPVEEKINNEFIYFNHLIQTIRKPIYEELIKLGLKKTDKKENFELKNIYWVLWGGLLVPKTILLHDVNAIKQKRKLGAEKHDAKVSFKPEMREPEKEKENLINHSFEKLETVDQYQGGLKQVDGSDELNDHRDALNDIKLNSLTRSSEETTSVFNSAYGFEMITSSDNNVIYNDQIFLDEWDYRISNYRKKWCKLFQYHISEKYSVNGKGKLMIRLINNYSSFVKSEKMKIESILNALTWKKKLLDGDELDVDQYIQLQSEAYMSGHQKQNYYMHKVKNQRQFSILILFDQSMSTDSWVQNKRILDIELEAIGLFGLLTKNTNDQIMIAGFNSVTRHNNQVTIYKKFEEPWQSYFDFSDQIEPIGYTRLGPAIRFAKQAIAKTKSKTKLLIVLTDGKPTDYDGYEGKYGIEDVRQSIRECEKEKIFVHALAIDAVSKNHFHFMFGHNHYSLLKDAHELPIQLLEIYKKSLRLK